jgi:hypothetical protein
MTKREAPEHKGKTRITRMEIRPLKGLDGDKKGSLISETHHETARGGQGGGPAFDNYSEEIAHPSMAHLVRHVKDKFGNIFGEAEKKGENEPEGGSGKPEAEDKPEKGHTEEPGEEDEVGD